MSTQAKICRQNHSYPFGLFLAQFQLSLHMSSIFSSVFQLSTLFACSGIAKTVYASPSLLPWIFLSITIPDAFSKAAQIYKTLVPFPVPKLKIW